MRRGVPISPPETLKAKWEPVLQTLEARVREMHHLSTTNHWNSWHLLQGAVEGLEGVSTELAKWNSDILQHAAGKEDFFQNNYDICMDLSEQVDNGLGTVARPP